MEYIIKFLKLDNVTTLSGTAEAGIWYSVDESGMEFAELTPVDDQGAPVTNGVVITIAYGVYDQLVFGVDFAENDVGSDPISAEASTNGATLTITINDPAATKASIEDSVYVDGSPVSGGTFVPGTTGANPTPATYTITAEAGTFDDTTTIGLDEDGNAALDGTDFTGFATLAGGGGDAGGDGGGGDAADSVTVYSLTKADHGVAADGLYIVTDDPDMGGTVGSVWKAYAVTGNDQVGYVFKTGTATADSKTFAAEADFNDTPAGAIAYEIVTFAGTESLKDSEDAALTLTGTYALKPGSAEGKYDAYAVTGNGTTSNFSVALEATEIDFTGYDDLANPNVVGMLAPEGSAYGAVNNDNMFEIVMGDRSGNIIEYIVKLKDDAFDGDTITLTNLYFNVGWDENYDHSSGGAYSYWGQFKPQNGAPTTTTNADVQADIVAGKIPANGTYFSAHPDSTGLSFGAFDDGGMSFKAGDQIATFMLTKNQDWNENELYIETAQFSVYDAHDTLNLPELVAANYQDSEDALDDFVFPFTPHPISVTINTESGSSADNVELFVTNASVNDGLSLVPVSKSGNLITYQIVMNVPIPTFYEAETDNTVKIDGDRTIVIDGAQIFDNSISVLTEIATGETADLLTTVDPETNIKYYLGGSTTAVAYADMNFADASYTGHEFFDLVQGAMFDHVNGGFSDLTTSSSLKLDISGLTLPSVGGDAAEGRYVIAQFTAVDMGETESPVISYTSKQNDSITGSSQHEIHRMYDDGGNAGIGAWDVTINDGAEVVALGDGIYINERSYNDAIGAEDALGALRISKATAAMVADQFYSKAEVIAADFNMDGKVSSADAYDILQYAVKGPEPDSPMAKWVYIDDIDGVVEGVPNVIATPTSIKYDGVTDTFIGKDGISINATAVLIGDVTSSFVQDLKINDGYGSSVNLMSNLVADFVIDGWNNKNMVETIKETVGTKTVYKAVATSDDLVFLGADTGIHIINANPVGSAPYGYLDVVLSNYGALDALKSGEVTGVTNTHTGELTYDSSSQSFVSAPGIDEVINEVEYQFSTSSGNDGDGNPIYDYDYVWLYWNNESVEEGADLDLNVVMAFDLNRNGSFEAGSDLLIWVEDAPMFDFVGDPTDPGMYYHEAVYYWET